MKKRCWNVIKEKNEANMKTISLICYIFLMLVVDAFQLNLSPPILPSSPIAKGTQDYFHVLCDNGLMEDQYAWMEQSLSVYVKPSSHGKALRFVRIPDIVDMHAIVEEEEDTTVIAPSINMVPVGFQRMSSSRDGGAGKEHSKFHRLRYDTSPYKNVVSYPRYCQLESMIADIVKSYIHDKSGTRFCLLIHPSLQYDDSILSYFTVHEHERTIRITTDHAIGHPDLVIWTADQNKGHI